MRLLRWGYMTKKRQASEIVDSYNPCKSKIYRKLIDAEASVVLSTIDDRGGSLSDEWPQRAFGLFALGRGPRIDSGRIVIHNAQLFIQIKVCV